MIPSVKNNLSTIGSISGTIFSSLFKSVGNFFLHYPNSKEMIAMRCCTWHDICAVVAYVIFCINMIPCNGAGLILGLCQWGTVLLCNDGSRTNPKSYINSRDENRSWYTRLYNIASACFWIPLVLFRNTLIIRIHQRLIIRLQMKFNSCTSSHISIYVTLNIAMLSKRGVHNHTFSIIIIKYTLIWYIKRSRHSWSNTKQID